LFYNSINGGKSQTRSQAHPLGGKEGFKDLGLGFLIHSLSGVADRQDDVSSLLLRFDEPGHLDHVFQRVGPIDDRPVSPRLDELLRKSMFFFVYRGIGNTTFFAVLGEVFLCVVDDPLGSERSLPITLPATGSTRGGRGEVRYPIPSLRRAGKATP